MTSLELGKETLVDPFFAGTSSPPAIDGDRLAWIPSFSNDVRVVNLATGAVTRFSEGRQVFKATPRLSGNWVVWQENRRRGGVGLQQPNLMLGDLTTGAEEQITDLDFHINRVELEPRISGNLIVWQDIAVDAGDVYMYDLATRTTTAIATGPDWQRNPAVSGHRIVWEDNRHSVPLGTRMDIFMRDVASGTETRITPPTRRADARFPAISGDRIVWAESDDIFLYDLTTSTETRLQRPGRQQRPAIWQDRIVWEDDRHGNWDIYLYDLTTGAETRITTNAASQGAPSISGNRIVWSDLRNGGSDACYFEIDVTAPSSPSADPGGPYTAREGSAVRITDGGSMSADCSRLTRRWNLGDGNTRFNVLGLDHTYVDDGVFEVTLTVTDAEGRAHTASTTATIENVAPTVTGRLFPAEATTGAPYNVSAGFFDPGRNDELSVTIDFDDGGGPRPVNFTTTGTFHHFTTSHNYAAPGTYGVTAIITDNDGGSATITQDVVVQASNSPPVADAGGPYDGVEGSAVILSLTGTDPDGNPLTYSWSLGDGTTGSGPTPPASHIYGDNGEYAISLTVDDGAGGTDTRTTIARVSNVAPSVSAPPVATLIQHESYTAAGSFTDPGADSWIATVDYGQGAGVQPLALVGKSFVLGSQYRVPGSFTVRVAVTDDDHGVGGAQATVTVMSVREAIRHMLISTVDELVTAGRISESHSAHLKAKVEAILDLHPSVDLALYPSAVTLALRGYTVYVGTLVRLKGLSAEVGALLTQNAERIIVAINTP